MMEKRDLLFVYLEVHGFFKKIYPLKKTKTKKKTKNFFFAGFLSV